MSRLSKIEIYKGYEVYHLASPHTVLSIHYDIGFRCRTPMFKNIRDIITSLLKDKRVTKISLNQEDL